LDRLLAGKHKPTFNQRLDRGDFVVVLNVDKVAMDGPRWDVKKYTSHSGYPGGKKTISAEKLVQKFPERVLEKAVWGMLPKNNYRLARMWRLKLINGSEHQFNDKFENAQVYRVGLSEQDRAVLAVE
jgi:large subunit ribosomal protein L13